MLFIYFPNKLSIQHNSLTRTWKSPLEADDRAGPQLHAEDADYVWFQLSSK